MTTSIVVEPQAPVLEETVVETPESKIPEKYRGKSPEDLVSILQNMETTVGRQANEIGTLRKFTDMSLGFAREVAKPAPPQVTKPQVTTEDLLANPDETVTAIAKRVADERSQDTDRRTANLEAQLAVERFSRKYPDFEQTMADPKFQEWIEESPYRQKVAQAAAARGDFEAADELFGLYKISKSEKTETTQRTDPLEAARKASTVRKGGSSAAGVARTSSDGKKIYSRLELIDERIKDPEGYHQRYESLYHDAYKEGRVR